MGLAIFLTYGGANGDRKPQVQVKVPKLSAMATGGRAVFDQNCASCHGKNAAGTNSGPPLIHKIYESNHHSDISFQRAARFGVRAHHWQFGNMPPISGIGAAEVTRVVAYIRELQRANGIF